MKKTLLLSFIAITSMIPAKAQEIIKDTIEVSFNKVVVLDTKGIAPTYDIGSPDVIYNLVGQDTSMMKLAARYDTGFEPTSLFLQTEDNLTVLATLVFKKDIKKTYYQYKAKLPKEPKEAMVVREVIVEKTKEEIVEEKKSELEQRLMALKPSCEIGEIDDIAVIIDNIIATNEKIFFRVQLFNESNVNYPIDLLAISKETRKSSKRKGMQEKLMIPLSVMGTNPKEIKAGTNSTLLLEYDLFTFSKDEHLVLYVRETNGGRSMEIKIKQDAFFDNTQRMIL